MQTKLGNLLSASKSSVQGGSRGASWICSPCPEPGCAIRKSASRHQSCSRAMTGYALSRGVPFRVAVPRIRVGERLSRTSSPCSHPVPGSVCCSRYTKIRRRLAVQGANEEEWMAGDEVKSSSAKRPPDCGEDHCIATEAKTSTGIKHIAETDAKRLRQMRL